jgi:hypothetical protein
MSEKTELIKSFEKTWNKSKKFIAFLLMEALLYSLALVTLLSQDSVGWPLAAFMFGVVVSMGAMALAFNGRQAQLDAYVRGMAMVGRAPQNLKSNATGAWTPAPCFDSTPPDYESNDTADGGENGEV